MNSFTSPMTDIITEAHGTIDKYIGDCIMAFWNAPLDDPDHAKNAVRAAQEIRRKLVDLNRGLKAEAKHRASPITSCASASASIPANASSAISAPSSVSIIRCSAIR